MYLRYTGLLNVSGSFRTDAVHPVDVGSVFTIYQAGIGTVTVVGETGVTINGPPTTDGQYTCIQAIKSGADMYDIIGGVL